LRNIKVGNSMSMLTWHV